MYKRIPIFAFTPSAHVIFCHLHRIAWTKQHTPLCNALRSRRTPDLPKAYTNYTCTQQAALKSSQQATACANCRPRPGIFIERCICDITV